MTPRLRGEKGRGLRWQGVAAGGAVLPHTCPQAGASCMKNTRGVCAALTAATTAAGTVAVRGAAFPGVSVSTPPLLKAIPVMCPLLYQTWPTPPGTRVGPRARRQKYLQLSPTCFLHWPCDVGQGLPEPQCLLLSTMWATSELMLKRPVAMISWYPVCPVASLCFLLIPCPLLLSSCLCDQLLLTCLS